MISAAPIARAFDEQGAEQILLDRANRSYLSLCSVEGGMDIAVCANTDYTCSDDGHEAIVMELLQATTLRALGATTPGGRNSIHELDSTDSSVGQSPLLAPTVFNFFSPGYKPTGAIATAGLVAPELQIATEASVAAGLNFMRRVLTGGGIGGGDGRVTISAKDATIRQILAEWARVGQTRFVNAERVSVAERRRVHGRVHAGGRHGSGDLHRGPHDASVADRLEIDVAPAVGPEVRQGVDDAEAARAREGGHTRGNQVTRRCDDEVHARAVGGRDQRRRQARLGYADHERVRVVRG